MRLRILPGSNISRMVEIVSPFVSRILELATAAEDLASTEL